MTPAIQYGDTAGTGKNCPVSFVLMPGRRAEGAFAGKDMGLTEEASTEMTTNAPAGLPAFFHFQSRPVGLLSALIMLVLSLGATLAAQNTVTFKPADTPASANPGASLALPVSMSKQGTANLPRTFSFDVIFDSTRLNYVSATAGTVVTTAGGGVNANLNGAGDTVSVSCVNPGTQAVQAGTVVTLNFTMKQGATTTLSAATPGSAITARIVNTVAADTAAISSLGDTGRITFRPSLDVNLNGSVNVSDVQNTVNIILATVTPAYTRQGDATRNGTVNVSDVQAIVNGILAPASFPSITTPSALPTGATLSAYPSTTMAVTGGTAPYTWALSGGSLPSGVSMTAAGVISGTATLSGTHSPEITVTDAAGNSATLFATLSITGGALQSITITPSPASVNKGGTTQLTATGHFSDSTTANITSQVVWASQFTAAATVGAATGLVTGVSVNSATITATDTATSVTANVTVNVINPIVSITINPTTLQVNHQATSNLTASATFFDTTTGSVTSTVNWTSANPLVASVGLNTGLVTGVAPGSTIITATDPATNVSRTVDVTVNVVLSSLAVTPANPSIVASQAQQMTATATFSDNSTSNVTSTATWTSGTTAVATINTAGLATSLTAGSSLITAQITINGVTKSGNTTLTVTAPVLQSIAITPTPSSVNAGSTVQFTATGTFNVGSPQNITTSVTWSSSNTAKATIGASTGLATGLSTTSSAGTTNISCISGAITSNTVVLTVNAVLQSIAITPTPASVNAGSTVQFTATGTYLGQIPTVITTSVTWASSNTAKATIGAATGLATALSTTSSAGTTNISCTSGTVTSNSVVLTVNAVLQSIAVTPTPASVNTSATVQFTATGTYLGQTNQTITTSVTWSSSDTSKATIGASTGLASGVAAGTTNISCTLGSVTSNTVVLTVSAPSGVSYATQIVPLFATYGCSGCHGGSGGYFVNSYANTVTRVTPGNAAASVLWQKVSGNQTSGSQMPQGGPTMSQTDQDKIQNWINQGALNN
jgi:uncharacterized protein YjdB